MSEQEKSWEERFDELCPPSFTRHDAQPGRQEYVEISSFAVPREDIKSFIRTLIADEREKAIAEYQLKMMGK